MSTRDPLRGAPSPPRTALPPIGDARTTPKRPQRSRWVTRVGVPRILLVAYVVVLAAIAFWPTPVDRGAGPLLRLVTKTIPFLTYPRIEFGANILLFVPLGVLLTLVLATRRWLVMPLAFLSSVTIECVQAIALSERTPSVLDIVANTAGACVGIVIVIAGENWRQKYSSARHHPPDN